MTIDRRNRVAQWAYDTRGILGRFHLWLDDVDETWLGDRTASDHAFVGESLERAFIMANAVTALGTRLFGRWAEGGGPRTVSGSGRRGEPFAQIDSEFFDAPLA